jgi:hypothetical protein
MQAFVLWVKVYLKENMCVGGALKLNNFLANYKNYKFWPVNKDKFLYLLCTELIIKRVK